MRLPLLVSALRPGQWTKNFFVFAGLLFSLHFFEVALFFKVSFAFVIFCLLSSAVYLINDLTDIKEDQAHPTKRHRPIASGLVALPVALLFAVCFILVSLVAAFYLDLYFALVALTYLGLMLCYTFALRKIVILDVFAIATGFVLRAIAGVVLIRAWLSPWLLICTILLALFIALGKRRHELVALGETAQRSILAEYSPQLLDQLISVTAGATVMAYALYTLWPETAANFGTTNLVYSVPFVLYGVFRYLYLIYKKEEGGRPEEMLLSDFPLLLNIVLWIAALFIIFYG